MSLFFFALSEKINFTNLFTSHKIYFMVLLTKGETPNFPLLLVLLFRVMSREERQGTPPGEWPPAG